MLIIRCFALVQGFAVSLLYCFLSSEVKQAICHRLAIWREKRNIGNDSHMDYRKHRNGLSKDYSSARSRTESIRYSIEIFQFGFLLLLLCSPERIFTPCLLYVISCQINIEWLLRTINEPQVIDHFLRLDVIYLPSPGTSNRTAYISANILYYFHRLYGGHSVVWY